MSTSFIFTSVKTPVYSKGVTQAYYRCLTSLLTWGGWKVAAVQLVQGRFHWICVFPRRVNELNDIQHRFFSICAVYYLLEMERKAIEFFQKEKRFMGLFLQLSRKGRIPQFVPVLFFGCAVDCNWDSCSWVLQVFGEVINSVGLPNGTEYTSVKMMFSSFCVSKLTGILLKGKKKSILTFLIVDL